MSVTSLLYQTFTICALFAIRVAGDKVCYGTSHRAFVTSVNDNYRSMTAMYTNCTQVYTNLEITQIYHANFDLSFLRNIRYVGGYVLITGIGAHIPIPLDNLQVIRGNNSYKDPVSNISATLAVTINGGITRLRLPKLREISKGNVLFNDNVDLKYVNRIRWSVIQKDPNANVTYLQHYQDPDNGSSNALNCTGGHGWDDNPLACQEGVDLTCDSVCNGSCYGDETTQCCHPTCALGCSGGLATECSVCRDFKNEAGACIGYCPPGTYNWFPLCSRGDRPLGFHDRQMK